MTDIWQAYNLHMTSIWQTDNSHAGFAVNLAETLFMADILIIFFLFPKTEPESGDCDIYAVPPSNQPVEECTTQTTQLDDEE